MGMKKELVIAVVGLVALTDSVIAGRSLAEANKRFINHEMVSHIKSQGQWTPFEVDENPLLHTRDISSMVGANSYNKHSFFSSLLGKYKLSSGDSSTNKGAFSEQIRKIKESLEQDDNFGASKLQASTLWPAFDARTHWGTCIHGVRD